MIHVGNVAAAIGSGLCETVLLPMARAAAPASGAPARRRTLAGRYEQPCRPMRPPTLLTIPVLSYMRTYVLSHEQLTMVSVVQREWAGGTRARSPGGRP
jgi:hypothetical protein